MRHSDERIVGKALALRGLATMEKANASDYARAHMADDSDLDDVLLTVKSAVGGSELGGSATPAFSSLAEGAFDATCVGQVPGKRQLPFVFKDAAGSILGTGATWRKNGRAIRVAPVTFAGVAHARLSVAGITVCSREFLDLAIRDGTASETLSRLMRDAIRREVDSAFCGANAAVAGEKPAGLGNNAQAVTSTGATVAAISADINSVVGAMTGGGVPFRSAAWLLSSEAYSTLATLKILDYAGTLAGRPVVTDAPSGTFMLVAADFLSYSVGDNVSISVSTAGSIEMDDAPAGDVVTPTAATSHIVHLFQEDALALRATLDVNWSIGGPSDSNGAFAVVALTGASYA
jgi:hypothetical protein